MMNKRVFETWKLYVISCLNKMQDEFLEYAEEPELPEKEASEIIDKHRKEIAFKLRPHRTLLRAVTEMFLVSQIEFPEDKYELHDLEQRIKRILDEIEIILTESVFGEGRYFCSIDFLTKGLTEEIFRQLAYKFELNVDRVFQNILIWPYGTSLKLIE